MPKNLPNHCRACQPGLKVTIWHPTLLQPYSCRHDSNDCNPTPQLAPLVGIRHVWNGQVSQLFGCRFCVGIVTLFYYDIQCLIIFNVVTILPSSTLIFNQKICQKICWNSSSIIVLFFISLLALTFKHVTFTYYHG